MKNKDNSGVASPNAATNTEVTGKHTGQIVHIDGVECYLGGVIEQGKLVGYILQPTDEFESRTPTKPKLNKGA